LSQILLKVDFSHLGTLENNTNPIYLKTVERSAQQPHIGHTRIRTVDDFKNSGRNITYFEQQKFPLAELIALNLYTGQAPQINESIYVLVNALLRNQLVSFKNTPKSENYFPTCSHDNLST
jgi:hypothetical protein